jgi:uncharacterized protein (TIGR02996 family)
MAKRKPTLPEPAPLGPGALAFLQAIKEKPDDDAARLIFADWLEERGDARGELIRVQVEIAAMKREQPQGWGPLRSRERKLRRQYGKSWLGPLHDLAQEWEIDRGLFSIKMKTEDFLRCSQPSPAAAELWPWIYHLEVRDLDAGRAASFAMSPLLGNLTALDLYCSKIGPGGMEAVAATPYLGQLRALEIAHNQIGAKGVAALVGSPYLTHLTNLNLFGNQIGNEGVRALQTWPHLSQLRSLALNHNHITTEGVLSLAASSGLCNLTGLDLTGNEGIGEAGAVALSESPHLANVKVCRLNYHRLGDEAVTRLKHRFGRGLHCY